MLTPELAVILAEQILETAESNAHPYPISNKQLPPLAQTLQQKASNPDDFSKLPKPVGGLKTLFSNKTEIFLSGAAGAGPAFLSALQEAMRFGLDINQLKVICATSAGTIIGLGLVLGLTPEDMLKIYLSMPTEKFQDYSLSSIFRILSRWGLCEGKFMTSYFKKFIIETIENKHPGMLDTIRNPDDPTFSDLQTLGFDKEFRVVVANVTACKMEIWSHKNKPHMSVAEAMAASCNLPIIFPPKWILSENGEWQAIVDGGLMCHFPLREGSPYTPPEQQLGFLIANKNAVLTIDGKQIDPVESMLDYFGRLFTMSFYSDPLRMNEASFAQTVAISVTLNPLKFKPNEQELADLLHSGRLCFLEYVLRVLNSKSPPIKKAPKISFQSAPLLFGCPPCKRKVAESALESDEEKSVLQSKAGSRAVI
jgi:predicted acylesterase/phospholipase RssA